MNQSPNQSFSVTMATSPLLLDFDLPQNTRYLEYLKIRKIRLLAHLNKLLLYYLETIVTTLKQKNTHVQVMMARYQNQRKT